MTPARYEYLSGAVWLGDQLVIRRDPSASLSPSDKDALMRRVAAALNALEGVPTEDLERIVRRFPDDEDARLRYLASALRGIVG